MKDHAPFDLVGTRVLVGVQMIDISRLSAHPVPLTDRGLITVAGQGPKDSNGAGKSSFIAALSLLHADDQWRLASGAPGAAELLFTAELAAQEARWANADRGYVIGVFADPAAQTPDELEADALTVWLRINRTSPYLNLRWRHGLVVPTGSNDAERASGVHALWESLGASNGRDDFHAGRLAGVLYGGRVRCVSFLSTSVRATPNANLLAQALNELSPARIFDALATMTGLDRELEQEQALRSAEHNRRSEVLDAERELARWQQEMTVVETGIARRQAARGVLYTARGSWTTRCARHLLDGVARVAEIRHAAADLDAGRADRRQQVAEVEERLRNLADDDEFAARFRTTQEAWRALREQERDVDTRRQRAADKLEELQAAIRDLTEQARRADGRDGPQAAAQLADAQAAVEGLLADRGAALAEAKQAADQVTAADSGEDLAAAELRLLQDAGIPAAALLSVLDVDDGERAVWEPRLRLYRQAVAVPAGQSEAARHVLAGRPGAVVVIADAGPAGPRDDSRLRGAGGLPRCTDERLALTGFLSALEQRAGAAPDLIDAAAGVIVTAAAGSPVTGRTARIDRAEDRRRQAVARLADLDQQLARARTRVESAADRVAAAAAGRRARELTGQVDALRDLGRQLEADHERLHPALEAAEAAHAEALGDRRAREDKIQALRAEAVRLRDQLRQADGVAQRLDDELTGIDLAARQAAWGRSVADAEQHLLALADDRQLRSVAEWTTETCLLLEDVTRRCFPDDIPPEELPAELRTLLVDQRWRRLSGDSKVSLVPDLTRALHTHLMVSTQQDEHDQRQIDAQRAQRGQDLTAAHSGLADAQRSAEAYRAVLAQGITAKLATVGEEFDRLDREYGGYGAGLDCPQPEPPTEPDRPWRWGVTPKWRRADGQRMSGYNLRGNTAQMDEKAVKLVCAAALAGGNDRPLLLILDELGRNLGKQHRREAVALFERIGRDRNITVVGALQDDMERYAIEASNLYIKLRRSSDAVAYNDAPVVLGDDTNRDRIAMLAAWMSQWRPLPRQVGAGTADLGFTLPGSGTEAVTART